MTGDQTGSNNLFKVILPGGNQGFKDDYYSYELSHDIYVNRMHWPIWLVPVTA